MIQHGKRRLAIWSICAAILPIALLSSSPAPAGMSATGTPSEMVASYDALADTILAVRNMEDKIVRSILGATYAHAQAELGRARAALKASDSKAAGMALENLATVVGQLGTEGDSAVAAIRKRLVEGGHHHNASGEDQGLFDEGYVVVNRTAKKSFLEASKAIGQLAGAPDMQALETQWKMVQATWNGLMK